MRIQYQSDLHMEFCRNLDEYQIPVCDSDVIVLAGDIGKTSPSFFRWVVEQTGGKPTVMCLGNHEAYFNNWHQCLESWQVALSGTNVHVLHDESIDINGVRFITSTLWTDYQLFGAEVADEAMQVARCMMNDHRLIMFGNDIAMENFLPKHAAKLHKMSVEFITRELAEPFNGPKVVVTHHAPSSQSIAPIYDGDLLNTAFASDLTGLISKHQPSAWIHGHMHNSSDYMLGKTRVVCNPRGYSPGEINPEFKADAVLEIG